MTGPAPLAIDPRREFLYAGLRGNNMLASYRIDAASGGLTPVGTVELPSDPCYLATDQRGRFLMGAYYFAGMVTVHRLDGEGGTEPVQQIETYEGAHSIQTDPANQYAFVPHIAGEVGPNLILQYGFDQDSGRLTPNTQPELSPEPNAGPRHFCIHPRMNVFYFSNEQGSSVTSYEMSIYDGVAQSHAHGIDAAARIRGREYVRADTDRVHWQVPVCAEPGPQQHRVLRGGRVLGGS